MSRKSNGKKRGIGSDSSSDEMIRERGPRVRSHVRQ